MHRRNTILIIEDIEIIKKTLCDVLAKNYNVVEADNGLKGLQILEKMHDRIAVIVLDLNMPVMDGFQFLDKFKEHQEYSAIPVIVATSNEDDESQQRCLEHGVWDFVMKPYNPVLLQFRIKNAMEKSRLIMAEKDPVTGIYSKVKFYQSVKQLVSEVSNETFAFVRLDIDRFKMINNFYGINEGNRVLMAMAEELKRISTTYDNFIYGRIENDVFAICMPHKEEAIDLVVNALQIKLKRLNKDFNIKISCGVYIITDRNMDVYEMYDRAFLAARSCKGRYVQNIVYYDESMIENMRKEQFIVNEVNRAIEEEQFEVFLQPKVNLVTELSYGAEALVRWKHPDRGMIAPNDFIPVYEKNGIIGRLDQYMWRHVCAILRRWLDEGKNPNPISVNVSRVNIYNPHLVTILKNLTTEYSIPPSLLNLELTESAFMEDQELVMKKMSDLHRLGFKIMMDDFGSGYSSLNVLKDMEVDYLKVDMKFLQQINEDNGKGEKVLVSVIRMAKLLHMPSIVEGVETAEQVEFLKCIGAEYAQGYYFARPMPVKEYEAFLEGEKIRNSKSYAYENTSIINELWNSRSNISRFFDMITIPVAIYEYRNSKIELLRYNTAYENTVAFDEGMSEIERERRRLNEKAMLKEAFDQVISGEILKPIEYQIDDYTCYSIDVKIIGKRADTNIMMTTYMNISEYK